MAANAGGAVGGFLQAFTEARSAKADREARKKLASLQAKTIEQALALGDVKLGAQTTLEEMFTGTPSSVDPAQTTSIAGIGNAPGFDIDIPGRMNAAAAPMRVSQVLADPDGQMAAFLSGNSEELMKLAEFQQGGEFDIRDAALLAGINLDRARLNDLIVEREQADEKLAVQRSTQAGSIKIALDGLERFTELNSIVKDTFLETGLPFPEARSTFAGIEQIFNMMLDRPEELASNRDLRDAAGELNKEVSAIGRAILATLEGNISVARLELLTNSLISSEQTPGANRAVAASLVDELLIRARSLNLPVDAVGKFERLRDTLKSGRVTLGTVKNAQDQFETVRGGAVDSFNAFGNQLTERARQISTGAQDIAQMGLEQLNTLRQNAQQMSTEALEAASRRWEELQEADRQRAVERRARRAEIFGGGSP